MSKAASGSHIVPEREELDGIFGSRDVEVLSQLETLLQTAARRAFRRKVC